MQLGNCVLALAGDLGHTVQKFGITPSEVAVLRVIHGDDSVTEIEITGSAPRKSREERERLAAAYGVNHDGNIRAPAVEGLFPGAAARLFETFDELDMDDSFFKVVKTAPVEEAAEKPKRGRKAKAEEPEPAPAEVDADDEFEDMPDVMA